MHSAGLHFGHGTACARDEAGWMASHVLGLSPDFERAETDIKLSSAERTQLERLLTTRIEQRQPLAYLLGEAWFAGLRFRVDTRVLIPRSPLAELILDGFQPWIDLGRPLDVLDVGTGSGCIAAAIAWYWRQARVDAVDISPGALAVARENVRLLGLQGRVRLIESDLFAALGTERYDLIVSNPPYVPSDSLGALPEEYRAEPTLALAAGADGLDLVRRLLTALPARLKPGGLAVIEVGETAPALERLLADVPVVWLEFERGGEGVFLLDEPACREAAEVIG